MHDYLKLDLDFVSLFRSKLDENSSVQPFNPSFWVKKQVFYVLNCTFMSWTAPTVLYLWLVYPSFMILVAFCSVSLTCPPVTDLFLLKNSSKQI